VTGLLGPPASRLPHPAPQYLAAEQFVFSTGEGVKVQAKSLGCPLLTATASPNGIHAPPVGFYRSCRAKCSGFLFVVSGLVI
jgi:hypothetical protein